MWSETDRRLTAAHKITSTVRATYGKKEPSAADLVAIFDQCFAVEFNTVLRGGAEEPVYLPARGGAPVHTVVFTQDYFASALHEVAHWCLAGPARRQCVDYGYWYAPDGRSPEQQRAFEQVEVKPQAIEYHFTEACGAVFRVSADNLNQAMGASEHFRRAIVEQARAYCRTGLPPRAAAFARALAARYDQPIPLLVQQFSLQRLR